MKPYVIIWILTLSVLIPQR